MKTIIVATDYSKSSETAFQYAAAIGSRMGLDIVLLNSFHFNIHALNGLIRPSDINELATTNSQRLEQYAKSLAERFKIKVTPCSLNSMTRPMLEKLAVKMEAGFIVMGMKASTSEHFTGTASTIIFTNTAVPVLVIPEGSEIKLPRRLLYACDYQSLPSDEHLNSLKKLASVFYSDLQVFHVDDGTAEAEQYFEEARIAAKLDRSLATLNPSYKTVAANNILERVQRAAKESSADILVMSPHKYSFWHKLLYKSKTKEMAIKAPIPLLSIPANLK